MYVLKFIIYALGDMAKPQLLSSATQISRGAPNTNVELPEPTNTDDYPLYAPIKKVEGNIQCTGEAEYVDDIVESKGELFAAFVLAQVGNCEIDPNALDLTAALVMNYFDTYIHFNVCFLHRQCLVFKILLEQMTSLGSTMYPHSCLAREMRYSLQEEWDTLANPLD